MQRIVLQQSHDDCDIPEFGDSREWGPPGRNDTPSEVHAVEYQPGDARAGAIADLATLLTTMFVASGGKYKGRPIVQLLGANLDRPGGSTTEPS